jgi:hypothetical protein
VDNSNKSQVAETISQKGYEVIDIVVNAEGVRVEK